MAPAGPCPPALPTPLGSGGWSQHGRRQPGWELLGPLPARLPPPFGNLIKGLVQPISLGHPALAGGSAVTRAGIWGFPGAALGAGGRASGGGVEGGSGGRQGRGAGSPAHFPVEAVICCDDSCLPFPNFFKEVVLGWISGPPKFMSPRTSARDRIREESLRRGIQLKSYWLSVGNTPMTFVLILIRREIRHRPAGGRLACDDGGRNWSDAAASQERPRMPAITRCERRQGRHLP